MKVLNTPVPEGAADLKAQAPLPPAPSVILEVWIPFFVGLEPKSCSQRVFGGFLRSRRLLGLSSSILECLFEHLTPQMGTGSVFGLFLNTFGRHLGAFGIRFGHQLAVKSDI